MGEIGKYHMTLTSLDNPRTDKKTSERMIPSHKEIPALWLREDTFISSVDSGKIYDYRLLEWQNLAGILLRGYQLFTAQHRLVFVQLYRVLYERLSNSQVRYMFLLSRPVQRQASR